MMHFDDFIEIVWEVIHNEIQVLLREVVCEKLINDRYNTGML